MSIKVWPKSERPREKLLQYGAENLSDAELIAVLLGKGVKGKYFQQGGSKGKGKTFFSKGGYKGKGDAKGTGGKSKGKGKGLC